MLAILGRIILGIAVVLALLLAGGLPLRTLAKLTRSPLNRFSVDDEAAITFEVNYGGGKEIETKPLYFTNGINIVAEITREGVEVRYKHR